MRLHDYYRGWYHASRADDMQRAWEQGLVTGKEAAFLWDSRDPRSPMCAGLNAAMLFEWSSLCSQYNKPEWDVRVSCRQWGLSDTVPIADNYPQTSFWYAFKEGRKRRRQDFLRKLEGEGLAAEVRGGDECEAPEQPEDSS